MEKRDKKPLRKGDLIQLKIENLDTKGRAYGFYDENKIYTNRKSGNKFHSKNFTY